MMNIKSMHRQAMEISDLAFDARRKGDVPAALKYFKEAYELEAQAARALLHEDDAEPSRSVLFRSAATLAKECNLFEEAKKLIHQAFAGDPPVDIKEELEDLYDHVEYYRHLSLRGIELSAGELQMAITGDAIGHGYARVDAFSRKVQTTEALLYRTAERRMNRPYRERRRSPDYSRAKRLM